MITDNDCRYELPATEIDVLQQRPHIYAGK